MHLQKPHPAPVRAPSAPGGKPGSRATSDPRTVPSRRHLLLLALPLLFFGGCTGGDGSDASSQSGDDVERGAVTSAQARTPVHVDSVFPIEEEIRRFREGMTPVTGLQGGAASMEELVDTFLRRVESADTLGVAALALNRAEFAWLYYPHTQYVSRPYELSPALVWFQLQNRSSRGLSRLLGRYAGQPLLDTGFRCPDPGEPHGEGHIWHGCTVLGFVPVDAPGWDGPHDTPEGTAVEERLFGSILRVGDRYKLVSFSNEL